MVPPSCKPSRTWTWILGSAATPELHPSVANGTEWKLVAARWLTSAARRKCPQSLSTACLFEFGDLFLAAALFLASASLNLSQVGSGRSFMHRRHAKRQEREVPNTTLQTCTLFSCFPGAVAEGWGGGFLEAGRTLRAHLYSQQSAATLKPLSGGTKAIYSPKNNNKNAAFCR